MILLTLAEIPNFSSLLARFYVLFPQRILDAISYITSKEEKDLWFGIYSQSFRHND